MKLSNELISQFAKVVVGGKKRNSETTVYGTVVADGAGNKYVKLDGSDQLTPLTDAERPSADNTAVSANVGERVSILIKDHTATVTGNVSSPAVRSGDFKDLEDQVTDIKEFDIVIAAQVQANEGYIKSLQADKANVGDLTAANAKITELETSKADITDLNAVNAEITNLKTTKIDTDVANAKYATINDLNAASAEIGTLKVGNAEITGRLDVAEADISALETTKLSAEEASIKFANIDFSNIGKAAIEKFFSQSGMIDDLIVGEGTITGKLVGVTITGDLIEGNTVKADKLVVLGEDGLYYKLNINESGRLERGEEQTDQNGLNGSVILAKTITATKINVDDLVAFGATIGGFHITESSIYSGVKESVDNTTSGLYFDSDGQLALGDDTNYLKYFQDTDGVYKLAISASSVILSMSDKSLQEAFDDVDEKISSVQEDVTSKTNEIDESLQAFITKFSKYIKFASDTAITIGSGDSTITLEIDNDTGIVFKRNGEIFGEWDGVDFHTGNIVVDVNERAQFGNFAFVPRSDGSLSFLKVSGGES